ncbi:MAG: hypothetical protein COS29_04220, partial [Candidatus Omnitrophica bacterium CG02_land_8_20_14_3_00__42_8]
TNASININNESNTFRIMGTIDIAEPAGGATLYVNDTSKYINWTSNGTVTPVNITYSVNNGGTWTIINGSVTAQAGENSYQWTPIPDRKNESSCLVKIIHNITGMLDVNDTTAAFSILPVINVTKPTSGQNVYAGSTNATINWTYTGTQMSSVDIYFVNDTGQWQLLPSGGGVSAGSGGNGSFTWNPAPSYKKTNTQVRVWDNATNNVTNTSALFNIVGNVRVTAPDGGQNWPVGSSQFITWWRDSITLVNIYFSTDGGTSWNTLQTNYNTTGTTQWPWDIPNDTEVSNNFYVKVEDVDNPNATNDTSNASSGIMSVFDIIAPENSTTHYLVAGGSYDINWSYQPTSVANKTANAILQYSTDGGGNWSDIPGANITTNDGLFTWNNINGTVLSKQAKVRVIQSDNYNASNESENVFDLRGNLTVDAPTNGDNLTVATSADINWTRVGNVSTLKVEYSYDGGSSWKTLGTTINASNQTWDWDINASENTTVIGKIKLTDEDNTNTTSTSIGNFSLKGNIHVDKPDGGEVLTYTGTGTTDINWSYNGTMENVIIYYSNNSGATWTTIDTVEAVNKTYDWTIPNNISGNLSVKLADQDDPTVNDTSNSTFGIKGSLFVNYPNSSSGNWTVGGAQYVNWTPTGNYTEDIVIEYHNGTGWNTLGTQAPGINGQLQSFALPQNVPDDITTSCKARVKTNETNSSININNESNTYRIIGTLDISAPQGGATLYVNDTSKYINWTSNGTVTPVNITYSVNNGGTWNIINGSVTAAAGENSYQWTPIPDRKNESSCLVKIIHNITGMLDVNDTTAAFSILPVINVTKPTSGQNLFAGSDNATVNWTYTGTQLANVDILLYNNTSQWQYITTTSVGSGGNGSYTWPVFPEFKRTNRQIKVRDNVTQNVTNDSSLFNVVGRLIITQPNESVSWWRVGDTRSIDWTQSALGNVVHIQYANTTGGSWYNVTDDLQNASNGTYSWNIPDTLSVSNNFSIKLSDSTNPSVTYSASPELDIVAKFNITAPENGDVVRAGTNYDVTWNNTSSVGVSNVILEYSTAGAGGSWTNLINESDPNAVTL